MSGEGGGGGGVRECETKECIRVRVNARVFAYFSVCLCDLTSIFFFFFYA